MSNRLLKFMKRSNLNRFFVGFGISFVAILLSFYVLTVLWTFALRPVIGKSYPITAAKIETPVKISQTEADPDHIFKTGDSVILLFNVERSRTSTPILTSRLSCSNGFRAVINDRLEVPPTSRDLKNEPISFAPIPKGAGGVCQYTFESEQRFKFLGEDRVQEITYESVYFSVNNLGDK